MYIKVTHLHLGALTAVYTAVISSYVLSRFALAALYRPPRNVGLEPTIAIIVPAYNEGSAIARTVRACLAVDYPRSKVELIVVNDGSTDDTWEQIVATARGAANSRHDGIIEVRDGAVTRLVAGPVVCIDLGCNRGKRAAMAAGVRASSAEVLVFVDSDSLPGRDSVRSLVQGFADPKVGAIAGLTHARNATTNALTAMQATRYYVAFQLLKSAESVLGAVVCCSGCFAAYRRAAVLPLVEAWEKQRFLGVTCTYGDDRALTNMVLRDGWTTRYDSRAEAWTEVPDRYHTFFRQQLRWKKSWARESPLLLGHVWRSRARAFPAILVATAAGLLSPFVLTWNLLEPLRSHGVTPVIYLIGLYLVSMAYALLYRALRNDGLWLYALLGTWFYVAGSLQLVWAVVRVRDGKWGTRERKEDAPSSGAGPSAVPADIEARL